MAEQALSPLPLVLWLAGLYMVITSECAFCEAGRGSSPLTAEVKPEEQDLGEAKKRVSPWQ